mgnify:CR=1 FL=1
MRIELVRVNRMEYGEVNSIESRVKLVLRPFLQSRVIFTVIPKSVSSSTMSLVELPTPAATI